jgi:hypothetical protein
MTNFLNRGAGASRAGPAINTIVLSNQHRRRG